MALLDELFDRALDNLRQETGLPLLMLDERLRYRLTYQYLPLAQELQRRNQPQQFKRWLQLNFPPLIAQQLQEALVPGAEIETILYELLKESLQVGIEPDQELLTLGSVLRNLSSSWVLPLFSGSRTTSEEVDIVVGDDTLRQTMEEDLLNGILIGSLYLPELQVYALHPSYPNGEYLLPLSSWPLLEYYQRQHQAYMLDFYWKGRTYLLSCYSPTFMQGLNSISQWTGLPPQTIWGHPRQRRGGIVTPLQWG